jgi:hypothetical protein
MNVQSPFRYLRPSSVSRRYEAVGGCAAVAMRERVCVRAKRAWVSAGRCTSAAAVRPRGLRIPSTKPRAIAAFSIDSEDSLTHRPERKPWLGEPSLPSTGAEALALGLVDLGPY